VSVVGECVILRHTMADEFSSFKQQLDDTKEWLREEYKGIRTGRATPAVLDNVQVEAYGTRMPLTQVANVTVEDARTLRVNPFDPSTRKDIESSIEDVDLGLGISADESGLRVTFPELTTERREQLLKLAKQKLEDARKAVRTARDDVWDDIQKREKEGDITEDDKYRLKEEMERLVQHANEELEQMEKKKENEIQE